MEYFRTSDGQIQADFAKRLGIVLKQYHEEIKSSPDKYEVSLSMAILQSLLTNCVELLNNLKNAKNNPISEYPIKSELWGFDRSCIVSNTFHQEHITAEIVFRHIRNALSHPNKINLSTALKSTGYNSIGKSTSIDSIIFISSPDLNGKGTSKLYDTQLKAMSNIKNGFFPPNVQVIEVNGRFAYQLNGKSFHRICEIALQPSSLLNMCYALAGFLSSPLDAEWDGKTFNIKKLAA